MRAALLSDIHANLEALDAVVQAGGARQLAAWFCLGDAAECGGAPAACVGGIHCLAAQALLGDHDAAGAGLLSPGGSSRTARRTGFPLHAGVVGHPRMEIPAPAS